MRNQGKRRIREGWFMGWSSLKNGELLRTAEQSGVDVFLTGDGTLSYEQNLAGRQL